MGILGTDIPQFERSGSIVTMSYSNIRTKYQQPNILEHRSALTGRKNFVSLGDYSEFEVDMHLYKYIDSASVFYTMYGYLHNDVYFRPHKDGNAISGSDGNPVAFNITEMKLSYLNNTDFADVLTMKFEAYNYTNLSASLSG